MILLFCSVGLLKNFFFFINDMIKKKKNSVLRLVASAWSFKRFNWGLLLGAENSHNLFVSTQKHARNGRMKCSFPHCFITPKRQTNGP